MIMQKVNRRITVVLFALVATAAVLGNCKEFTGVFDSDGQRVCAVGQPDEVRLSTNTASLECVRLCDDNPECVVFNLYDNTTCEIFTCPSELFRFYRNVEFCKSFRINDCKSRCYQPECGFLPRDCVDVRASGHVDSGVYLINPGKSDIASSVYCDMNSSQTWLVFQRRKDGSENFERTWTEYADGFGDPNGEFWLGNEILYLLVSSKNYKLRVDLEDFEGQKRYAEYATFSTSSSSDFFRLNIAGYSGDAGDSLNNGTIHNGYQFSTKDADHDTWPGSCAQTFHGAWWYNNCHWSNLNGLYLRGPHTTFADGVNWNTFRGFYYSLKTTEMKIAPVN